MFSTPLLHLPRLEDMDLQPGRQRGRLLCTFACLQLARAWRCLAGARSGRRCSSPAVNSQPFEGVGLLLPASDVAGDFRRGEEPASLGGADQAHAGAASFVLQCQGLVVDASSGVQGRRRSAAGGSRSATSPWALTFVEGAWVPQLTGGPLRRAGHARLRSCTGSSAEARSKARHC